MSTRRSHTQISTTRSSHNTLTGPIQTSFQQYADVWFLSRSVTGAVSELECVLSCFEDEALDRAKMMRDLNALGNRPGISELLANFESFDQPVKKLKELLEQSLECLREIVKIAVGEESE